MQDSIYRFSVEHTLADTVDFIASVTGVETSNAAVSRFLAWYRVNLQLHRHDVIVRSLLDCKIDPDLTPEKTAELGHAFFSALALEQQDSRAWCQLQQIAIQRGRLSLQIQKFENHEKIIEQKNLPPPEGGISEETMALIERELNLF